MNESGKKGMISRRNLMLKAGAGMLAASLAPAFLQAEAAKAEAISELTPNSALQKLMEGNQRYIEQKRTFPDQARSRIVEVAQGQHPFATILACSDSRVAPEIIFDQGLGDLFDIRVAGNFLDDVVLGNIEYAALELGVPLLVILGHERCGAVKAALDGKAVPGSH
ncbi:carbonic anhydrase [Microcoleus vaginatus]|uniref:carbonic anhydrase n=1 Tax=Microcoleus vaginatus TaxID=119532 RepID=UPI00403F237D